MESVANKKMPSEEQAASQVIPPLGSMRSKGVNVKALIFLSLIGLIVLAGGYFLLAKRKASNNSVKKQTEEQVVIPERRRVLPPVALAPPPPNIKPVDPPPVNLAGTTPNAFPYPVMPNAVGPGGGVEPIPLALKRTLQGGPLFAADGTSDGAPSADKSVGGDQKNISDAESIIRRRAKESGSVVDFLGGVIRSQIPSSSSNGSAGSLSSSRSGVGGAGASSGSNLRGDMVAGAGVMPGGSPGGSGGAGGGAAAALLNSGGQLLGGAMTGQIPGVASGGGSSIGSGDNEATVFPVKMARAIPMSTDSYIAQGTSMRCVLETRIISDIDGQTMCAIAEPIYSANSTKMLIPKGSRLMGQYRRGVDDGNSRIGIIWNRLMLPNGVDVAVSSPGTDSLGSMGVGGFVDSHWGERLGSALLISLGTDIFKYASFKYTPKVSKTVLNTATGQVTVVQEDFESETVKTFSKVPEQMLAKSLARPSTVTVNQGSLVNIVLTRDLDFSTVN